MSRRLRDIVSGSTVTGSQEVQGRQGITGAGTQGATGATGTGAQGAQGATGPSNIPQEAKVSSYTLAIGDIGKHISSTSGGVTVPASVFSAGDAISIYNNSASSQTITQGASVTMYLGGTATTGNRTLAQRGIVTVLCVASNTFVIAGAGLT